MLTSAQLLIYGAAVDRSDLNDQLLVGCIKQIHLLLATRLAHYSLSVTPLVLHVVAVSHSLFRPQY